MAYRRMNEMITKALCIVIGVAALSGPSLSDELPVTASVKKSGEFVVANSLSYAPFSYVDENGKPAGLAIELANEVARRLGVKLRIETLSLPNAFPAIASGRVNAGWATYTVTPERLKQVSFIGFMEAGTVVVTTPENEGKYVTRTKICGERVAVNIGSAADLSIAKLNDECSAAGLKPINKMAYPEQRDAIQAVLSGRADLYLDDSTAASYYVSTPASKLRISGASFFKSPLGIAVAKNDEDTANMIMSALKSLVADGFYAKTLAKYNMADAAISEIKLYK